MRNLALSLLLFAVAGCSSEPERAASKPDVDALAGKRAAMDQPVPDFTLRDLTRDGAFVSLAELRGRAVVLFFLSPN
ncbi:MAG: hypothetical protein AAB074_11635 [Planctomycetota bacterium]